jgi:hypothetical protein
VLTSTESLGAPVWQLNVPRPCGSHLSRCGPAAHDLIGAPAASASTSATVSRPASEGIPGPARQGMKTLEQIGYNPNPRIFRRHFWRNAAMGTGFPLLIIPTVWNHCHSTSASARYFPASASASALEGPAGARRSQPQPATDHAGSSGMHAPPGVAGGGLRHWRRARAGR